MVRNIFYDFLSLTLALFYFMMIFCLCSICILPVVCDREAHMDLLGARETVSGCCSPHFAIRC